MKRIDPKAAITILLGAAVILAVLFSPAGDQGFLAIVLLGPLVTGLVAGALGPDWRHIAGAWAVVGLFMLTFDWIAHNEDQGVHAVLTLLMVALVGGGAGLARLGRRLTSHRAAGNASM